MSAESCHDATSCEWFHWEERVTNRCAVHGDLGDESFEEHQTIRAKRFTGAELAAEYWRARADHLDELPHPTYAEYLTVRRFAILPHHDEVTA